MLPATDTAFAWHDVQEAADAPENMLAAQVAHAPALLAPTTAEDVPAVQFTHVFTLLAPVTPEYVPFTHFTHVSTPVAPATPEYVPATQLTHALPDRYCPGAQVTVRHTPSALAPVTLDALPTPQAVHALAPAVPEYVFTGQFAHTAAELAPTTPEYAPTAQLIHTDEVFAPATSEYAPAGQSIHDALPVAFLNFPATQAVQRPPSGPVYPTLHLQALCPELNIGELLFVGHAAHEVWI